MHQIQNSVSSFLICLCFIVSQQRAFCNCAVEPNVEPNSVRILRTGAQGEWHSLSGPLSDSLNTKWTPFSSSCVEINGFEDFQYFASFNYSCYLFVNTTGGYFFNATVSLPAYSILLGTLVDGLNAVTISCSSGTAYALEGSNQLQIQNLNLSNCPILLNLNNESSDFAELSLVHSTFSDCVERPAVVLLGDLGMSSLQVTLNASRFSNNIATVAVGGAALHVNVTSDGPVDVTIVSSVFDDNAVDVSQGTQLIMGGAVYLTASKLNVSIYSSNFTRNSNFYDRSPPTRSHPNRYYDYSKHEYEYDFENFDLSTTSTTFLEAGGGAMAVISSGISSDGLEGYLTYVKVVGCIFKHNQASGWGGAVYVAAPNPQMIVEDCKFFGGHFFSAQGGGALAVVSPGAALPSLQASIQLLSSLCIGLINNGEGGCFYISVPHLILNVINCTSGVEAFGNGGTLALYADTLNLTLKENNFDSVSFSNGDAVYVSADLVDFQLETSSLSEIYVSADTLNLSAGNCSLSPINVLVTSFNLSIADCSFGTVLGGSVIYAAANSSSDSVVASSSLSTITLRNSLFQQMITYGSGGAVYVSTPVDLIVEGCHFIGSTEYYAAGESQVGNGGAIAVVTAPESLVSMTVRSSTFETLAVSGSGSAVYISAGVVNLTVEDCTFNGSLGFGTLSINAVSPGHDSSIHLKSSIFSYNKGGVGAVYASGIDKVWIEGCLFVGNLGYSEAGAVAVYGSSHVSIKKSIFGNNTFVTGLYYFKWNPGNSQSSSAITPQTLTARNGAAALFISNLNVSTDGGVDIYMSEFAGNTIIPSYVTGDIIIHDNNPQGIWNWETQQLPAILEGGASPGRSSSGAMLFQGVAVSLLSCNVSSNTGLYTTGGVSFHAQAASNMLTIQDCNFLQNSATHSGTGSLYITSPSGFDTAVNITSSLFTANLGTTGGALWVDSSSAIMKIMSTAFVSNTATGGQGGALYASGDLLLLYLDEDTELIKNSADSGGAIYFAGGQYQLVSGNCSILNNTATTIGGAIAVGTGSLRWSSNNMSLAFTSTTNVVFNNAGLYGGALSAAGAEFVLILDFEPSALVIKHNSCGGVSVSICYGGAFYLQKTALYVGCPLHVTQNTATIGGGIYSSDSEIYLETIGYPSYEAIVIQENSATAGGGLYLAGSSLLFSTVHSSSSCFAYTLYIQGNTAKSGGGAVFADESEMVGSVAFISNVASGDDVASNGTVVWEMGCGSGNGGAVCLLLGNVAALQLNASQLIDNVANNGAGVYARRSNDCAQPSGCHNTTLSLSRCAAVQNITYASFSSDNTTAASSQSYYYLYFYEQYTPGTHYVYHYDYRSRTDYAQITPDVWGDYLETGYLPACISPNLWINGNQARDNGGIIFLEDESITWNSTCELDNLRFLGLEPCSIPSNGSGLEVRMYSHPPSPPAPPPAPPPHSPQLACPGWAGNVAGSGVSDISATSPTTFTNLSLSSRFMSEGFLNVLLTVQTVTSSLLPSKSIALQVLSMSNASLTSGATVTSSDVYGTAVLNLTYQCGSTAFVNSTQSLKFAALDYAIQFDGSQTPEVPVVVPPCGLMQYRPTQLSGCVACPPNQYSFDVSSDPFTSCYPCPGSAFCNTPVTYTASRRRALLQTSVTHDNTDQNNLAAKAVLATDCSITTPLMMPQDGYWQANPFSYQILKCPNAGACSGGCSRLTSLVALQQQLLVPFWMAPYQLDWGANLLEIYVPAFNSNMLAQYRQAECAAGYTGNLCGTCVEGYGSRWNDDQVECLACLSLPLSQLAYAAQVLLPVLFLCILLYTALKQFDVAKQARVHRVRARHFADDKMVMQIVTDADKQQGAVQDPDVNQGPVTPVGTPRSWVPLRSKHNQVIALTSMAGRRAQSDSVQATEASVPPLHEPAATATILAVEGQAISREEEEGDRRDPDPDVNQGPATPVGTPQSWVPLGSTFNQVIALTPMAGRRAQLDSLQATEASVPSLHEPAATATILAVEGQAVSREEEEGGRRDPGDVTASLPGAFVHTVSGSHPAVLGDGPYDHYDRLATDIKANARSSFVEIQTEAAPTPDPLSLAKGMDANVFFKLFFSHCQMLMVINNAPFAFPQNLQNMISLIATMITSVSALFPSADCSFFGSAFDRVITRQLLAIFVVAYVTVGLLLCLVAIRLCKLWYSAKSRYHAAKWWELLTENMSAWAVIVLIVTSYYYYPSVTIALLSLFQCQAINSPQDTLLAMQAGLQAASSYWSLFPDQACYQGYHLVLVLCVGVPGLLLVALGLPFGIFFYLRSIRQDKSHFACFAFLHEEYRETVFFWEGVLLGEKFLLTAALSGAVFQASSVQFSFGILVAIVALGATTGSQPYVSRTTYWMSLTSLGGIALSLYLCLFLSLYNDAGQTLLSSNWEQAVSVLFIVTNACVLAVLLILFIVAMLPVWRKQYSINSYQLEAEVRSVQARVSAAYGPLVGRCSAQAQRIWYQTVRTSIDAFDRTSSHILRSRAWSRLGSRANQLQSSTLQGSLATSQPPTNTGGETFSILLQALKERDTAISHLTATLRSTGGNQYTHVRENYDLLMSRYAEQSTALHEHASRLTEVQGPHLRDALAQDQIFGLKEVLRERDCLDLELQNCVCSLLERVKLLESSNDSLRARLESTESSAASRQMDCQKITEHGRSGSLPPRQRNGVEGSPQVLVEAQQPTISVDPGEHQILPPCYPDAFTEGSIGAEQSTVYVQIHDAPL